MRATPTPTTSTGTGRRRLPALKVFGVVLLLLSAAAAGAAFSLVGRFYGSRNLFDTLKGIGSGLVALRDPQKYFPGQSRMTVLCLGLDRNIFRSKDPKLNGMPYTKGARSDVMMLVTLDLFSKSATVLSIPRDTRVQLPGDRKWSKINEAHARGGIPFTIEAVEQFLNVKIDHYVVIKQEAIESVVDALGGLKLKVAHDMDYDDSWGQLHVHLKEGEQLLKGQEVVGFMRFRKDQEGDFGRIRRQQQVIQVLAEKAKSPMILGKAPGLITAIRRHVQTDLTPDQQIALAHLFHKTDPANIQTAALPTLGTETIDYISYVIPDEFKKEAAVEWLVNGDQAHMNRLIKVELRNASGDRELYQTVYDCLRHYGFDVERAGRARGDAQDVTRVVQRTNLRGAGRRVLDTLQLRGSVEKLDEKGADVTLYVGKDLAENAILASSESWPEIPERPRYAQARLRRVRHTDEPVVRVRSIEEAPAPETPEQSGDVSIPGSPEPKGTSDTPGAEAPAPAPGTEAPAPPAVPAPAAPSGENGKTGEAEETDGGMA